MRISLLCNTRIMSEDVAQNRDRKRRNSLHGYYLLLVYCYGSVEWDFLMKQHLWNIPILSLACPILLTLWKCFVYNIILRSWYPIIVYVESIINSMNITSLRFICRYTRKITWISYFTWLNRLFLTNFLIEMDISHKDVLFVNRSWYVENTRSP